MYLNYLLVHRNDNENQSISEQNIVEPVKEKLHKEEKLVRNRGNLN